MMQYIYFWAKKIHNLMMWFAIILGVPIAITGVLIEEPEKWETLFNPTQMYMIRDIHGEWSGKFAIVLAVMMVTGFLMWLLPRMLSRYAKTK